MCGSKTHKLYKVLKTELGSLAAALKDKYGARWDDKHDFLICCLHFTDPHPAKPNSDDVASHLRSGLDGNKMTSPSKRPKSQWQEQKREVSSPARVLSPAPPIIRRRTIDHDETCEVRTISIPGFGKYDDNRTAKSEFLTTAQQLLEVLAGGNDQAKMLLNDLFKLSTTQLVVKSLSAFAMTLDEVPRPIDRAKAALKAVSLLDITEPSTKALADALHISVSTVYRAQEDIENEKMPVRSSFQTSTAFWISIAPED